MTATNLIAGASSYDQVPYRDAPERIMHPRHLETVATLFGMSPQNVTRCSVLELGCAAGSNLIAQAYDLPESKFLGLDFSEVQIAKGHKMIEALGLTPAATLYRSFGTRLFVLSCAARFQEAGSSA